MNKEKLYCHWDAVRFLSEEKVGSKCVAVAEVLTDSQGNQIISDLMMYAWKNEQGKYVVNIYTTQSTFDEFVFENWFRTRDFLSNLHWQYPEYKKRPYIIVE